MFTRNTFGFHQKTDLHCHLDGSLRLETLLDLARDLKLMHEFQADSPEGLTRILETLDHSTSLADFLIWFKYTIMVMQTYEGLHRIAYELVEDARHENVKYLEIRYSPILHTEQGLTLEEVNDAVLSGMQDAEAATGTKARLIIQGFPRPVRIGVRPPGRVGRSVQEPGRGRLRSGRRRGREPGEAARPRLQLRRDHNLNLTCHAGEAWGPASINQALHDCRVHIALAMASRCGRTRICCST